MSVRWCRRRNSRRVRAMAWRRALPTGSVPMTSWPSPFRRRASNSNNNNCQGHCMNGEARIALLCALGGAVLALLVVFGAAVSGLLPQRLDGRQIHAYLLDHPEIFVEMQV